MKKILILLLLLTGLYALNAEILDKIVAKIGNDVILLSDVQKQMYQIKSSNKNAGEIRAIDVLTQMIQNKLVIQKAKELNLRVDESRIKLMAEKYVKEAKANFPTEADFYAELRKMKMTQTDLQKYYADLLTDQALTELLVDSQISKKIYVSDSDIQKFYTTNRDTIAVKPVSWKVGMIMREIKASPETETQKFDEIKALLLQLKSGADFATLARANSDCPSKEMGGDLGFFKKGMMVAPFEKAAFELQVGENSDIVKTQFGYHIIQLKERKGDEIRAAHILKMVQPTAQDSIRERDLMASIVQQYKNGRDFAGLAAEYSMDDESKAIGGIIGEFSLDEFPELFAPVLETLPLKQMSEVLSNEGMLYVFVKLNELPSRFYTYDELKDQIKNYLFTAKQREAFTKYMEQLQRDSYVEITL
ncbi:MAG: peptidylprolyl isomerase [Candidatus Cloacimonetes bacterium HGW-Cloacimonetes-1]|jgi:parvulin-like peptidyl-prolyl isomerase|nr:MAG: peptidylprolyl isomerase [Candidatus Cloacimonetes bacterium HGW-Cloacimonetes-1]